MKKGPSAKKPLNRVHKQNPPSLLLHAYFQGQERTTKNGPSAKKPSNRVPKPKSPSLQQIEKPSTPQNTVASTLKTKTTKKVTSHPSIQSSSRQVTFLLSHYFSGPLG